jgi:hypothetical protein
MLVAVADLLDRLSIAQLKAKHYPEAAREATELERVYRGLLSYWGPKGVDLMGYFASLQAINAEIWGYESALRQGKMGEYDTSSLAGMPQDQLLQLAAVGLQAINIRNTNLKRKQVVNEVCELTQTGFQDIKVNHASSVITVESPS